jgi:hypothetical protein
MNIYDEKHFNQKNHIRNENYDEEFFNSTQASTFFEARKNRFNMKSKSFSYKTFSLSPSISIHLNSLISLFDTLQFILVLD